MQDVQLRLDDNGEGAFFIADEEGEKGEMVVSIKDNIFTAIHTEVLPEVEGKGYSKKLLDAMVAFVRKHHMKVIPLCPYVYAQFRRHPEQYADIWKKNVIKG